MNYKFNFEIANVPFCIISNRKSVSYPLNLDMFKTNHKRKPKFEIIFKWVSPIIKKVNHKNYFDNYFVKKDTNNLFHLVLKINPRNKITKRIVCQYIFTLLTIKLISNKSMVLHSSSGVIDNKAVLFSGRCNEGKTTLLKRLIKNNNFEPIHEDVNVLVLKKDGIMVYPFLSLENKHLVKNKPYKLHSLYFIKKSKKTLMKKLDKDKIFYLLESNQINRLKKKHKKNEDIFKYLNLNFEKLEINPNIKYYNYNKKYLLMDFKHFKVYEISKKVFQFLVNRELNVIDKETLSFLEELKKLNIIKSNKLRN